MAVRLTRRLITGAIAALFIVYVIFINMLQPPTKFANAQIVPKNQISRLKSASCKAATNIAFLKVHKAGSSTISNILQRFGTTRRLNFVLPQKGPGADLSNYIGSRGQALTRDIVLPITSNETYNILCNHINYDHASFHQFFPSNTLYISIIREPFSQFISAADYWHYYYFDVKKGNMSKQVSDYLKNPYKIKQSPQDCYVKNRQAVDFGFKIDKLHDDRYIKSYIQELDKDFHFVMIMEYFDESLIMLKRLLCWELKDILYIKQNSGSYHMNVQQFNSLDRQRYAQLNKADVALYDFFLNIFWLKMRHEDSDFLNEVSHFKARLKDVKAFCQINSNLALRVEQSPWNKEFVVYRSDCELLLKAEVPFFNQLLKTHKDRHKTLSRG